LPDSFMTWRAPRDAPDVAPLPALSSGRITYGSFNACYKITPALAAIWARILQRVLGSRLMLVAIGAGVAAQRVRDLFQSHGIGPDRLVLVPRVTHEEFLLALGRADVALDSFPFNGITTSCFSLWMGLPLVSLAGATHASRAGASILGNLGLPHLVARNADEYVDIAAALADDLPALARLRADLRGIMLRSPLMDGAGGARAIENAFRDMWSAWCRSPDRAVSDAGPTPGGR